jgi:NADPH-dependent ferric siderophore reductase
VVVRKAEYLGPRMIRVTVTGSDLAGLTVEQPAASVRLLLPPPGSKELVVPSWNGNEFLMPDGRRPTLRTLTPRRVEPATLELDVDVVVHDGGPLSEWAQSAGPGDAAAVSGPGRGYTVDTDAPAFLLAGDETAIPAISQLLAAMPPSTPVQVHIEIARPDARLALPDRANTTVDWYHLPRRASAGSALVDAMRDVSFDPRARIWIAGEAAAMQAIRRHLFQERGVARAQATVRGYWKLGTSGDADDDS